MRRQSTSRVRACARCGEPFTPRSSQISRGTGIYCSPACHHPPVMLRCEHCGCSFRVPPSDRERRYCSPDCFRSGYIATPEARFWRRVKQTAGCWTATIRRIKADGVSYSAPRFAYRLFFGPITPADWVLHSCDNPRCVNPAHLSLGDHAENMRQMSQRGRAARPAWTKLTAEKVVAIRALRAQGWSGWALAKMFDIAPNTVYTICKGRTWK